MRYLFLFLVCFTSGLMAQEKVEREYRITPDQVPQKAQQLVDQFTTETNIKWIQEVGLENTTIEAKFVVDGNRYSIEFTREGILEDVEVVVAFSSIPENTRDTISAYLNTHYDYMKIEKVQIQFVAEVLLVRPLTRKVLFESGSIPSYELVVKTRNRGEKAIRYELLFTASGELLSRTKVISRSDNILRF